jgi:hypothetical protein
MVSNVTGVSLTDLNGAIAVGASVQLEALISPADATNQNVFFESEDESIATVTESGMLTAVSDGLVTVTVTTADGGFISSNLIQVLSPSGEFNWALEQPVVGSDTPDGSNDEDNLVDDNTGTRWSVRDFPQSAIVDLEADIKITQTEVTCYENRAYQFIIEGALNQDGPYTTIVDRSENIIPGTASLPIINAVDSIETRYVRITVSGANVYTGPWVSLTELRVFGEGERMSTNVNEITQNNLVLTPNPASDLVTIEGAEAYDLLSVYDQSGRLVYKRKIMNADRFDISELHSGVYLVKLESLHMITR